MKVLELQRVNGSLAVAIVDDPKDGTTKLVIISAEGDPAVVLDFDSLVSLEELAVAGPSESKRVTKALRPELWDSESGHAVS